MQILTQDTKGLPIYCGNKEMHGNKTLPYKLYF